MICYCCECILKCEPDNPLGYCAECWEQLRDEAEVRGEGDR